MGGAYNVGTGYATLNNLTTGSFNISVGAASGSSYTTSESSNVCINSNGVTGDSNVLRIGTATGAGQQQLSAAYICGIDGVNVGSVATVVTEASNQLGTAVLTAGSGIWISAGANTITLANTIGAGRYVVAPTAGQAGYTVIQNAINQAVTDGANSSNPATVWIWPGSYTENLTLNPYVNLAGATDPSTQTGVSIIGNSIYPDPSSGNLSLTNVGFATTNASAALSFQSSVSSTVHLQSVDINGATGIGLECTGSGMTLEISIGSFEAASGGICKNITNGFVEILCGISQFTDTASTISGGTLRILSSDLNDSFSCTGGTLEIFETIVQSTSLPIVDIGASGTVYLVSSVLNSSNGSGFFVSGSGHLIYSTVNPIGSAQSIDTALSKSALSTLTGTLSTSPTDSHTATTGFGTISINTAIQNTLGYDVLVSGSVNVSIASPGTLSLGVGPTSTPTTDPITGNIPGAAIIGFSAVVPSNYYLLIATGGLITVSSITNVVTPL